MSFYEQEVGIGSRKRECILNPGNFNFGNFGKFETRSQLSSSGSARLLVTAHSKILLLLAAT